MTAVEAAIAGIKLATEADARPAHLLTDAECVEAWHQLCQRPVVGDPLPPLSPEEEAECVRQWLELTA